jgi:nitrogen fixation-related uncharacterized protein
MVEALVVAAIVLVLVAALWFTRGAKSGPYAGEDVVLDRKARQLDDAFRERNPNDR